MRARLVGNRVGLVWFGVLDGSLAFSLPFVCLGLLAGADADVKAGEGCTIARAPPRREKITFPFPFPLLLFPLKDTHPSPPLRFRFRFRFRFFP